MIPPTSQPRREQEGERKSGNVFLPPSEASEQPTRKKAKKKTNVRNAKRKYPAEFSSPWATTGKKTHTGKNTRGEQLRSSAQTEEKVDSPDEEEEEEGEGEGQRRRGGGGGGAAAAAATGGE